MLMFMIVFMVVVSEVYTHTQTHQDVYIKCGQFLLPVNDNLNLKKKIVFFGNSLVGELF